MTAPHDIEFVRQILLERFETLENKAVILRAPELKRLFSAISEQAPKSRPAYGQAVNALKVELEVKIKNLDGTQKPLKQIDVTAPFDVNESLPPVLPTEHASRHPLTQELDNVIDIFTRMGFEAIESRQLDDDFHMFEALNFPENHPARDGYDTFRTDEGFIPPAHTSTMQHRILKTGKQKLEAGEQIASVSYGRCFRNEDVDATHEHTFYQCEGVFVSRDATLGQMLGTLRSFFETYYDQNLAIKTQPGYFPFVEPGLEFLIEKPATLGGQPGEWLEMLGCGMIHPNVLKNAGINPDEYRGFAWGGGIDRLVMLKYGIEDVRLFEAGRLAFLRKFA